MIIGAWNVGHREWLEQLKSFIGVARIEFETFDWGEQYTLTHDNGDALMLRASGREDGGGCLTIAIPEQDPVNEVERLKHELQWCLNRFEDECMDDSVTHVRQALAGVPPCRISV